MEMHIELGFSIKTNQLNSGQ